MYAEEFQKQSRVTRGQKTRGTKRSDYDSFDRPRNQPKAKVGGKLSTKEIYDSFEDDEYDE